MRIIVDYLKSKIKLITVMIIVPLIFAAVFSLYNLQVEAVLYASLLSFTLIVIIAIIDFSNFNKKHKCLKALGESVTISIENIPEATSLIEEDYNGLIEALFKNRYILEAEYDEQKTDMINYYTLWVHQIKTPIAAMNLILQEDDTMENRELQIQLFKIEQYVEMVLVFLRMGSDNTDYVFKEYDLQQVVKQSIRKYASMFIRKKINMNLKPIEVKVITDEKWLSFVIEQLISNAIKYTNEGGNISISAENNALIIEDTGIGIATEDLCRICEKGFTGYNGRKDKKASGIGLYLCKEIIKKLGHSIGFQSQPGKGTTVKIQFNTSKSLYD